MDDIENKKETTQYCAQVFPGTHLETQGTSKVSLFFMLQKVNENALTTVPTVCLYVKTL